MHSFQLFIIRVLKTLIFRRGGLGSYYFLVITTLVIVNIAIIIVIVITAIKVRYLILFLELIEEAF